MNILIPDSWLREYLATKATPQQIKEYLSLCGPSVERLVPDGKETVYDIEITSNRPDSMSVVGIAREAAAILPRFGISAKLTHDPYTFKGLTFKGYSGRSKKRISIVSDPDLCPRWTSVILDHVQVGDSPGWLQKRLTLTGIRPLNNVIDITNYLMRAYGQPAHAFDFNAIRGAKMKLRASKRGEKITTLDGKTHTLPGGDIVIEDGSGRLIDLCGIMGAQNSSIKPSTKTVVLFMQTYDPVRIRKTTMALGHRTEAGSLFEKGLDSELVLPTIHAGIKLLTDLTKGSVASPMYDLYKNPYKPYAVSLSRDKLDRSMGKSLSDKEIRDILLPLGFRTLITKTSVTVTVPSFRRDVTIDVDIIEEISRIWGYHNISPRLPEGEPPVTVPSALLAREEEVKIRLRDWGYTEVYPYSMISEKHMHAMGLDIKKAYAITNPLSEDWVYLRPASWPTMLEVIRQNIHRNENLRLFELATNYVFRPGDLPDEQPILLVAWTGNDAWKLAKGMAEALFDLFGIPFPEPAADQPLDWYDEGVRLALGKYGSMGKVSNRIAEAFGITRDVILLDLDFRKLAANGTTAKSYRPLPKHPEVVEDLALVVPEKFAIGPLITALKKVHPLVSDVSLLDVHESSRTLHIVYRDPTKNLTAKDVTPVREKIIRTATEKFGISLKD